MLPVHVEQALSIALLVADIVILWLSSKRHGRIAKAARYLAVASLLCLVLFLAIAAFVLSQFRAFAGYTPGEYAAACVAYAFVGLSLATVAAFVASLFGKRG